MPNSILNPLFLVYIFFFLVFWTNKVGAEMERIARKRAIIQETA